MRTRSAASALVVSGHVRIGGERVTAPSRALRAGDVITVALDRQIRILKVVDFIERRGGADAGRALYSDLTPEPPAAESAEPSWAQRDAGSGRPTKHERRATDRLKAGES